ncbi:protein mono-ADP-ribosyltransferase PARP14-like [Dendronephthya gigantea]|uniref:protein mono-ADP-ribosyltransferase PARP14-like n=1 Tax=Dendronephthya gigantea TaxID=151771 RepID=UPI00106DA811|nr:protein mono-ADP-ribosyltransferase PARP14-like [Dendronephthya gigantea]
MIKDEKTERITVKGSPTQIEKFKIETQEIVGFFEERSLNGNRFSLLKANKAISHVKSLLTAENSTVEVVVDDKEMVTLYGMKKTDVDRAFDIIVNAMVEIKLPDGLRTKSSQDALLNELGTSTPLLIQREDGVPRIVCFKKHSQNLHAKIDDFKEQKKTVEQRVRLPKAVLRYLSTYGETTLEGLRLSSPGLKIEIGDEALVLSGEKPVVENCCVSIQDQTKDLKVEKMDYGTPETASSIKGMAYMAIESIERKHRCGIEITVNDQPERQGSFRSQNASTVSSKEDMKRTMQCRYTFPNGKIIEVHQGNILEHPVHYLVNSANNELQHSWGLAGAIVRKGGRKIQEDCFRALNQLGTAKLLPGNVVTTDGGKLMCKEILHVVVPAYRPSDEDVEDENEIYLRHCCTNVLESATKGQTIAIPALGTRGYSISAKSLVAATCDFLQKKPSHSLQEVHFVDYDPSAIEALMKEILTRFSCDLNLHINEPVRDRWRPLLGASGGVSPLVTTKACDHFTFKTPEGMEVRLTIGNIAKSTSDIIVNTATNDLNLTRNPSSKAILDEAGSALKTFCVKWIEDNGLVNEGDFAITDGAKLKCKKVFHVKCPRWTADQGEKKLREVVQKLLSKTAALSLTSISMPALGTGKLRFPEKLVAKILFEEAIKFSSDHKPSSKIKLFNVVVYKGNKTAVDAFKEQFQVFSPTADVNARKAKRGSESGAGILKTTRKKISGAFDRSSGKEKDKTHGVEVEIVQGNIVEESTDAIGFLVAEDITQGGQIGRALYRGAGEDLRKEYINIGLNRIDPGTVVMTTAGNLKVCKLLHMVIKAPTDKSTIQNAVTRCLNDADMYGFASLSLPAVGTGHLQKDGKQSAEILYHCIKEYRKRNDKSLKLIRIVILQENVFEEFRGAFARKDPGAESSKGSTRKTRQQITLEIAAESSSDIAAIKEELKRVEAEQCHTETIETQQVIDVKQLAKIMEIQDLHDVRIECEPTIGYIRISGLARNVAIAVGKIHNIIHEWERERHHADVTVREVEWLYYEGDRGVVIPERYAKEMSAKIETEYKRNPSGTVEVGDDEKYKIDFKTMTETCLTSNEDLMKVYRRPCQAFPFPGNWEYQPIDGSTGQELQVFSFNIEKQDTEYHQIHNKFQASLSLATNVSKTEVVKIERIQNPGLYQLYQAKKREMSDGGNEMLLYHGTTKDAVEKINRAGFNRSYSGKLNAFKFGNGVYFAREAWYSSRRQYAAPDEKGLQYMYIAKVLVGKYTKGNEGLIVPPPIDTSNPNVSYDSLVDNVAKPLIYVVFYDYQHYPEYLITFKEKPSNELPQYRLSDIQPAHEEISEKNKTASIPLESPSQPGPCNVAKDASPPGTKESNTWFKDTFLNSRCKLKKEIHEALRSFPWLCGAYGLSGPNKKICRPHIYLTIKRGMKKSDVRRDLQEKFNVDTKQYFELLQEPKENPNIKFLVRDQNTSSVGVETSSSATPVLPAPGGGVLACSGQSNHNPCHVPEGERDLPDVEGTGTLTMFCCKNGQHYALTCFHVACASDEARLNAAINKRENIQQMRDEFADLQTRAREKEYLFKENRRVTNNEAISFGDDESNHLQLGEFENAHFNTKCDILSLKIPKDVQLSCKISGVTSPDWNKINGELNKRVIENNTSPVHVEKNGFSSGLTKGYIVPCDFSYSEGPKLLFKDAFVVEGYGGTPFLEDGDSGSLVFFRDEKNVKQAFSYGVCEVSDDLLPKKGFAFPSQELAPTNQMEGTRLSQQQEHDVPSTSLEQASPRHNGTKISTAPDHTSQGQATGSNDCDSGSSSPWSEDSDDGGIVFQEERNGLSYICLPLYTALRKLELLEAACFNDCANSRE